MGLENLVIPSERSLALAIEKYSEEHLDTYESVLRTTTNKILIQVRYDDENQTIGIEGYFTETPELLNQIHEMQEDSVKALEQSGYATKPSEETLKEMRDFRYDGTNFPEKSIPPWGDGTPPWEKDDPLNDGQACCLPADDKKDSSSTQKE